MFRGQWKIEIAALAAVFFLIAPARAQTPHQQNPARPGFNAKDSDARAIAIADEVMAALGGRENWDNTRYITWSFFGRRTHVWDKHTANIRLEDRGTVVLMNLNSKKGRAWKKGVEITDSDSLQAALDKAESAWINDSYWMFMPYKLKDTGVTLTYRGEGTAEDGRSADILQLTFQRVGRTPENMYRVYVDKSTRLVCQWDYFRKASDAEPGFKIPWKNWQKYGRILLSDDRGRAKHTGIAVYDELPPSVFGSPEPVDFAALAEAAAQKN